MSAHYREAVFNTPGAFPPQLITRKRMDGVVLRGHWGNEMITIRRGLERGATRSGANSLSWDLSSGCCHPFYKQVVSKPHQPGYRDCSSSHAFRVYMDMYLPCRACHVCLRRRRNLWVTRIRQEISAANRTWFGTLTLSPAQHYQCLLEGAARSGIALNDILPSEEWNVRVRGLARYVTLWLKRLRKHGAKMRYCLVVERHKSGLPHLHVAVMENGEPVRKALLQEQWPHGFTNFKLVQEDGAVKTAFYVAKYLIKSKDARVRASLNFGEGPQNPPQEIVLPEYMKANVKTPHQHTKAKSVRLTAQL